MSGYRHHEVSMSVAMSTAMRNRTWQRNPRRDTRQPEFLCHRFPIKGGITFSDVLVYRCMKNNALLASLFA